MSSIADGSDQNNHTPADEQVSKAPSEHIYDPDPQLHAEIAAKQAQLDERRPWESLGVSEARYRASIERSIRKSRWADDAYGGPEALTVKRNEAYRLMEEHGDSSLYDQLEAEEAAATQVRTDYAALYGCTDDSSGSGDGSGSDSDSDSDDDDVVLEKKASATKQLIQLAEAMFDFTTDDNGKAIGIRKGTHIARPVVGSKRSVRQTLEAKFYRITGKTASQKQLAEVVGVLGFKADEQTPVETHLRSARHGDDLYIDLGDKDEHVVRVSAAGWEVLGGDAQLPVLFRRTNLTKPLPMPQAGGDLDQLWRFVNLRSEADRQLMKGWLVDAHLSVGRPCPIVAMLGEQGTAKTSSMRCMFALVDPTRAPVRRPPSDVDRLLHAAAHSRAVGFDNMSAFPQWLSDGMCRLVTGEGDVDRALYTDDEARVITLQSIVGITSIDLGALNGDLAERTLWGNLEVIPASERRSEAELNEAWDEVYAQMFGGLLDLIVEVLRALPQVELDEMPRMADFARTLAAMDAATGTDSLRHYMRAQTSVSSDIVQADTFLSTLTETITERWQGSGKDLHALLPKPAETKFWPEARGMSGKLKRVAPDLRKAGWTVENIPADPESKRAQSWVLIPPGEAGELSDEDLIDLQLAVEDMERDIERWEQRVLAAGATQDCAREHALAIHGNGDLSNCEATGCDYDGEGKFGNGAWRFHIERTRAINRRWRTVWMKTGRLKREEIDRLIAERSEESGGAL